LYSFFYFPNINSSLTTTSVIYRFSPSFVSKEREVNFPSIAISLPLVTYFSMMSAVLFQATMLCVGAWEEIFSFIYEPSNEVL